MLKFGDYLTIFMAILAYIVPMGIDQSGLFASFVARTLLALLAVVLMIHPCGWIRRYKSQKNRDRLLALPVHTVVGTIPIAHMIMKAEYGSVPSGYSIGPRGNTYFHYRFGTVYTSTGRYYAYAHVDNQKIMLESLPKDFSDKKTVIPTYSEPVTISYVTDTDGKNYFINASQN